MPAAEPGLSEKGLHGLKLSRPASLPILAVSALAGGQGLKKIAKNTRNRILGVILKIGFYPILGGFGILGWIRTGDGMPKTFKFLDSRRFSKGFGLRV